MKVLVDDEKVYAIGEKNVRTARRPEGSRVEEYPDDTEFERVDGGFVVKNRPPDWDAERERLTRLMKRREAVDRKQRLTTIPERIERIEALLEIDNG